MADTLILRRSPLGYLMAFSLLVLEVLLAPLITAQILFQLSAGVSFTLAEIIGPITGFTGLGVVAIWITTTLLRAIPNTALHHGRSRGAGHARHPNEAWDPSPT